jgi:octaprenyl-diphosphate synthase
MGKNLGDDLAEGKPTLPIIRALQIAGPEQAALLREAITSGGRQHLEEVAEIIDSTDGIDYTLGLARGFAGQAKRAVSALPESLARNALTGMADFAVARSY